jgi:hypothetical protein
MNLFLRLFLGLSMGASSPATPRVVAPNPFVCGDSTEISATRVRALLAASQATWFPAELRGLATVDANTLRLLDPRSDATVCRALRQRALADKPQDRATNRNWLLTMYEAGGYYFVVVSSDRDRVTSAPGQPRRVRLGEGGGWLVVFDHDLKLVTQTMG